MIAAYDVVVDLLHECRNAYVVPCLRIFCDQDVSGSQSEALKLVRGGSCRHEGHTGLNAVVLVNVNVVAESDGSLALLRVLVDVAHSQFADVPQSSHLPVLGYLAQQRHA